MGAIVDPQIQYGAHNSITSRPRQQPVQGDQMLQLIMQMLQGQTQMQQGRAAQQREALNPVHRGMGGGIIDQTTGKEAGNPFDNGFFLSGAQRAQREASVLGGAPQPGTPFTPPQPPMPTGAIQTVGNPDTELFHGPQGLNFRQLTSIYGTGASKLGPPTGSPMAPGTLTTQPQLANNTKLKKPGSSFNFGASASPRPGFSF